MEIKSSFELAGEYAEGITSGIDSSLCDTVNEIKVEEKNFNMGVEIYSDIQILLTDYISVLQRDADNIREIAREILDTDVSLGFEPDDLWGGN